MVPVLKGMIKNVATFMNVKTQNISDYKQFLTMIDKYEDLNLANYVEGDEEKMVFGNTSNNAENSLKA